MAVIFAVVGGGAVLGIATADSGSYSDHSDYSNYDNYSDYSDAVERERRRREARKQEIRQEAENVNQYKIMQVNNYLQDQELIEEDGETVSLSAVEKDGTKQIKKEEKAQLKKGNSGIKKEIKEIDSVIQAIDQILKEKDS